MMKAITLFLSLVCLISSAAGAQKFKVSVAPSRELTFSKNQGLGAAWLGYLIAREKWISASLTDVEPRDLEEYRPRFDEEVAGRSALAEVWSNMGRRVSGDDGKYLSDLVKVWKAKWMSEYVWTYLRQDFWIGGPDPARLAEFGKWAEKNLPEHRVVTHGAIILTKEG